jgi:hypothetical protein
MPELLNMHAYVFGCVRRPGLILPHLAAQSHTLHIGTDYMPPDGTVMTQHYFQCPLIPHYRVFRGHQDMARRFLQTGEPVALMFEDDASPNTPEWTNVVNKAWAQMQEIGLEVFYLYGRQFDNRRFQVISMLDRREIIQLRSDVGATEDCQGGKHHIYGCMAYLIKREAALRWEAMEFEGIPVDVILPDRFKFALLHQTPFDHDRRQGSLIDGTPPPSAARPVGMPARPPMVQRSASGQVIRRPNLRPGLKIRGRT